MSNQNKTLINNVASLGVVQIVNYVFPLITIPYVSRIIGPDGFGVINYVVAIVTYFILIVNYGFDFTATRKIASRPGDKIFLEDTFIEVFNARLLLFIFTIPIYLSCVFLFPILRENFLISLILYFNVISALLTPQYIFQGLQKLAFFSKVNLLRGIINTILIFALIHEKQDLLLYTGIGVCTNLLIAIFWLAYVFKGLKLKFRFRPFGQTLLVLWSDKYVFFSSIVFSLYTTTNIVILGLFDVTKNIGFYTTAITFITIVQSIINIPLSSALYPYIGKSFSEGKEAGIIKLQRLIPIIFYFNLCIALGVLFLSPFLIILVFGEKFHGSVHVVQILSILPLISGMSGIMGVQTMLNLKLDKLFLKITTYGAVLSIVLNLILDNFFGYIGTAFSYLITEIFIMIGLFFGLKQNQINVFKWSEFNIKSVLSQLLLLKRQFLK